MKIFSFSLTLLLVSLLVILDDRTDAAAVGKGAVGAGGRGVKGNLEFVFLFHLHFVS